ncbi:MAG TPA: glutathione transferase [Kofleriaceae bacterium]|nr:glutathione transferase [Kofleriaceae bacterium]
MSEAITLYVEAFWASPWTATVFATLREKQLDFKTSIGMIYPPVGALTALRELTYTGTAPVLQHSGYWIAESLAIVEYLEDVFPSPSVLPDDARDRGRARQLMSWFRTGMDAFRRERPTEHIFYPPKAPPAPLSARAQASADAIVDVAARLGADHRGALFGAFGVVDVDLAFALMRMIASGLAVPDPIAAYARAVWARPSVRDFVEHPRPPNAPQMIAN